MNRHSNRWRPTLHIFGRKFKGSLRFLMECSILSFWIRAASNTQAGQANPSIGKRLCPLLKQCGRGDLNWLLLAVSLPRMLAKEIAFLKPWGGEVFSGWEKDLGKNGREECGGRGEVSGGAG